MASGHPGDAVRQINRLFGAGTVGALTDGQLLERFATRRGEAAESAFEALVARHGPMVLRVARGTLRDPHDVEDAFQATFLVLVRRAGSIGDRELLGPWLHGVALRVSRKARAVAARRNRREGGIAEDPPAVEADAAWLDTRPILHEELGRLPEKYRRPVVLCHLQGLTHAEAAQELAWPVGTVSVRLARARKLLRERLTRRGLSVTGTLWGAGLASEGASAAISQALIHSTTTAAIAFASGRTLAAGVVSTGAMVLTRGVLMMMFLSKLKWIAVPMMVGVGTVGAVVLAQGTPAQPEAGRPPAPKTSRPAGADQPPTPKPSRSPFELDPKPTVAGGPTAPDSGEVIELVPPVVKTAQGLTIDPVPPDFFDLQTPANRGGVGSPVALVPVKRGQIVAVEVLEALPGRPITGERVVGPDGRITLGFYGDLYVEGLTRTQIKVKLIEHLRKYIGDETLGLIVALPGGKMVALPPAESTRVFADETSSYFEPRGRGRRPDDGTEELRDRIDELDAKLDRILRELRELRRERRPSEPGDAGRAQPR